MGGIRVDVHEIAEDVAEVRSDTGDLVGRIGDIVDTPVRPRRSAWYKDKLKAERRKRRV